MSYEILLCLFRVTARSSLPSKDHDLIKWNLFLLSKHQRTGEDTSLLATAVE